MINRTARKLTLKHETPRDRERRHADQANRGRGVRPRIFDLAAWERLHRSAEDATIFSRRDGAR
jgi:hypothetical protein